MSLEQEVANLVVATTELTDAVNIKKSVLDDTVDGVEAIRDDLQTNWGDKLATASQQATIATTQAGIATDKAAEASGSAATANAAKTVAELARDAAMVGAVTYPDEASGRAAVTDGEYFKVIGSGDVAAREYRRTNASTSVLVAEYPSVQKIWGRDNLSENVLFNGTVESGDLLSTKTKGGYYYIENGSNHADCPTSSLSVTLEVVRGISGSRYASQFVFILSNPLERWGRRLDTIGSGTTEWKKLTGVESVIAGALKNDVVGRDNIKTAFLYNGTLNSGDLLSTAQKDGLYIVATPSEHADAPENANDILSLEVRRLYGSGDWIHQIARQFARPDNAWARRLRISQGVATSWFPISGKDVTTHGSKIIDNTITHSKLNESFMSAGSLSSGSVNQPLKPGFYIVYSDTVTDLPEGIGSGHAGILEVLGQSSDGIMIQRVMHNGKPEERWVRRCKPSTDDYGEWFFDGTQPEPVINYPYDRLAGKKIVLFGDSLTANQLIPTYVAGSLPQSEIIDLSIGGTRIAKHPSAGWEDLSGWVIATAINTGDWTRVLNGADIVNSEGNYNYIVNKMNIASEVDWSDVDYIVAGYGTNDFSGTPIGELTSATHTEFCGGVNIFIEQILSQYPHIRLLFWTPPWQRRTQTHPAPGIEGGSDVSPNSIGKYLYEYADAMIEIGKMKKQIVIDMYRESGIYETTHQYYLSDLLHVTNAGARILADKIVGALQSKF